MNFKVGDKVRIRLSGECNYLGETSSPHMYWGYIGHPEIFNGKEGTVCNVDKTYNNEHWYCVVLDEGCILNIDGNLFDGDYFCAQELEPVDYTPSFEEYNATRASTISTKRN